VIVLEATGETYRASLGRVSMLPSLRPAASCRPDREESTAELRRLPRESASEEVYWTARYEAPLSEFYELARRCDVAAYLQFGRVPFWKQSANELVVGDLRYDREVDIGFAEVALDPKKPSCPPNLPAWRAPRSDLMERRAD
jgi:hypothetical protein